MALADEQYSYRGLTFGRGCDVLVNSAEGFEGFEVRSSDSDQPRGDGGIRGMDYVAPRTLSFDLNLAELEDGDGSAYEALWATVRSTFRPSRSTDDDLTFKRPGQPERVVRCRPISLLRVEKWDRFNRSGYPPVVLRAVDPRLYSTEQSNVTVPLFTTAGAGIDLPFDFPVDFPATSRLNALVTNDGDAPAFPLLRFYGPTTGTCTSVAVINETTGQTFSATPTGLTVGKILTADMEAAVTGANRLVLSIDGATRYGSWALPREPFALAPGDNVLRFETTGTATDVVCLVTSRSTWIS